jgi:hypothetical protein
MFIGHFAVGFAAKRWAPRSSLATLMLAALLTDVIWPVLVLAGVERARIQPGVTAMNPLVLEYYPWSHSLVMDVVWAALFGALVARGPGGKRSGLVAGLGVLSHWVLDFVSHAPDMPVWPGGPRLGLALWNSVPGSMVVEGLLFVAGVWLYISATRATDRIGVVAMWALVGLLALAYVSDRFMAPPPTIRLVAVSALIATAVLLPWTWWLDRHRRPIAVPHGPVL